jgi:hypothetical protein
MTRAPSPPFCLPGNTLIPPRKSADNETGECWGTGEGVETWRRHAGIGLVVAGVDAVVAVSASSRSFA